MIRSPQAEKSVQKACKKRVYRTNFQSLESFTEYIVIFSFDILLTND